MDVSIVPAPIIRRPGPFCFFTAGCLGKQAREYSASVVVPQVLGYKPGYWPAGPEFFRFRFYFIWASMPSSSSRLLYCNWIRPLPLALCWNDTLAPRRSDNSSCRR